MPGRPGRRGPRLDLGGLLNPDPFVRPGQRIGKYTLAEPIARGGMAEVWAARVEGPRGFVKSLALKFILESFAGDPDLERLFVNEARLAAQLQHANLVGVFDFDKVPAGEGNGVGRYYIVMERVHGHDLRRVLHNVYKRGGRLSPAIALHIAGEVLKGLRYVHERRDPATQVPLGLVHRDVSPHNILIGMGGEVKLSDFGIAKAITQSLGTQAGTIRGKLAYASPEQLRSEPLNHRTDQFALGVTLWEALAGQRLFEGGAEMEIIGKVLRGQVPPLPAQAGVPPETEAIVRRMLAVNADERFLSTAEALSAILTAPGYSSDATPLEALMREVFAPQNLEMPPTLPLETPGDGAAPVAVNREVETLKKLPAAEPIASGAFSERSHTLGRKSPHRGLSDGVPVGRLSEGHVPNSVTLAEPERSVTGSAYVSSADEMIAVARSRSHRPARIVGLAGALAIGVGGVVVAAHRPWESARPRSRAGAARASSEGGTLTVPGTTTSALNVPPMPPAASPMGQRPPSPTADAACPRDSLPAMPEARDMKARDMKMPGNVDDSEGSPDAKAKVRAVDARSRRPVRASTASPAVRPAGANAPAIERDSEGGQTRSPVEPAEAAPNGAPVLK